MDLARALCLATNVYFSYLHYIYMHLFMIHTSPCIFLILLLISLLLLLRHRCCAISVKVLDVVVSARPCRYLSGVGHRFAWQVRGHNTLEHLHDMIDQQRITKLIVINRGGFTTVKLNESAGRLLLAGARRWPSD